MCHIQSLEQRVNPYDSTSLTFPTETGTLSGEYGYQSLVVYSSNHNGTITCYPVPSHFQGDPRDQAKSEKAGTRNP